MSNKFKIYIDRLQNGSEQIIDDSFDPAFMNVEEKDLMFKDPVKVKAKAYLAGSHLVIDFHFSTLAFMQCSICNDFTKIEVSNKVLQTFDLNNDFKEKVFDFSEILRDVILIETPKFAECNNNCPQREELKKYLKDTKE
jgi:uncharacterized metal-binding protein YceD (DUF177 family)